MDDPVYEQLTLTVEGGVVTITLRRPERLNAMGVRLTAELLAALEAVEAMREARALILTAAGTRSFCSGADLKERATLDAVGRWAHNRAITDCAAQLARLPIPTIAAINGLALGGGCEITLACDFRLAVHHAEIALPEVGLGVIPGAGGTQRLPRLIGPTRAKEMIFTGRRISAAEAFDWGLLSRVTSSEDLLPAARALAAAIVRHSPLAVAYAKAAIDVGVESSIEQGLRYETAAIRAALASEDYKIGLAAFAAKEVPVFPPLPGGRIV
ncbi:enoyl-CoA hydratase/isomerase family protein [Oscillochloris sp. ZM17-4]|uniref:enoyl-CoA hydratase/isomerase family protein n=1 Tax=Oscillochloris sp. ZM17-4 TaxID=2866714 RepID=UPI001C72C1B4|nr:enoyl-CoA hydratase-related protein [Oscillochloris sp. ZM17-4]MBX0326487.1 enoyl-CoA hydratase/isomerase family protein [Oscillochloris sp. ZM17-4]